MELEIDSFLPTTRTLRTWCDRKKYISQPLFPSYVFAYLKNIQNYYMGLGIDGVMHYVRSGKEPARVRDSIITSIKMAVEGGNAVETTMEHFERGQQVTIQNGPFIGLSCEIVKVNDKDKMIVRLNLLRSNILATLPSSYLVPDVA